MGPEESQKALLLGLVAKRKAVPPEERALFDQKLDEVVDLADKMNIAVAQLMMCVACRENGRHFSAGVTARPVECAHATHPHWLCRRQRPQCGSLECWCAAEFDESKWSSAPETTH